MLALFSLFASFPALSLILLILASMMTAGIAKAQLSVDQSQLDGSDQRRAIHVDTPIAQSFIVGSSGFLAGVELSLTGPSSTTPLRVKILDATGGVLSSLPLGEDHLTHSELGPDPELLLADQITATYVDLTGFAIAVTAGEELAISLETTAPSTNSFATHVSLDNNAYPQGRLFTGGSPSSGDLAFKTFLTDLELTPGVDQYQLNGYDQSSVIFANSDRGQTWLVGANGLLEGIELIVSGTNTSAPLRLEIIDVSDGLVNAPVLGERFLDSNDVVHGASALHRNEIRATYIDLKALGIIVVAGDAIGIQLSTENAGPGNWTFRRALANLYADGSFFADGGFQNGIDLAFKTFVADPIFGDDFESGDLSRWHSAQN